MATPLLGWVPPDQRTQEQQDAHARAMQGFIRKCSLPPVILAPGEKLILTDFWKTPEAIADIGFEFTGYRQLTGSCLPAGSPVRMADGSEKPIEAVVMGDRVVTHKGRSRQVVALMRRNYTGAMLSLHVGDFPLPVTMTADHEVAVSCAEEKDGIEWTRADDIREGNLVLIKSATGFPARAMRSIERRPVENLPVFDFEVEEDHSFIAGGLTVHNCVGVSAGNLVTTLSCIQRAIATAPTKAFAAFWPFMYGRTRFDEGDRGQGEGAVDSVMGQEITNEGCFYITQAGLPTFDHSDGLALTKNQELQWSDGASSIVTKWSALAKAQTGSIAVCNSPSDIWNYVGNGYPVIDGCDKYCGTGSITGNGADAYVGGHYDGNGGHSTCFLGIYQHRSDGRLFLYSNQWDGSTYPKDPAGGGRCTVWLRESEVAKLFQMGGSGGETLALSHITGFPAQPAILNWLM